MFCPSQLVDENIHISVCSTHLHSVEASSDGAGCCVHVVGDESRDLRCLERTRHRRIRPLVVEAACLSCVRVAGFPGRLTISYFINFS